MDQSQCHQLIYNWFESGADRNRSFKDVTRGKPLECFCRRQHYNSYGINQKGQLYLRKGKRHEPCCSGLQKHNIRYDGVFNNKCMSNDACYRATGNKFKEGNVCCSDSKKPQHSEWVLNETTTDLLFLTDSTFSAVFKVIKPESDTCDFECHSGYTKRGDSCCNKRPQRMLTVAAINRQMVTGPTRPAVTLPATMGITNRLKCV